MKKLFIILILGFKSCSKCPVEFSETFTLKDFGLIELECILPNYSNENLIQINNNVFIAFNIPDSIIHKYPISVTDTYIIKYNIIDSVKCTGNQFSKTIFIKRILVNNLIRK